ncbi:MAG: hypothetical protein ACYSTN_02765 [Planctomycetota bacterium]
MSTYNWVVENLILPLSDLVLGRAISKHLRFVRKSQWWSAEELKEFNMLMRMFLIITTYSKRGS